MKQYVITEPIRRFKKYSVYKWDNENKEYKYLLSFGDNRYEQYKDTTPLKLYSKYDHLDKERRRLYFLRHGETTNKDSAKYWSNKYLW